MTEAGTATQPTNQERGAPMGLDMYLEARKYINEVDAFTTIVQASGMSEVMQGVEAGVAVLTVAIYWRDSETNCIHKWFVDNCAFGVDDGTPVGVYGEDLQNLHELVGEVTESRDTSKLPSQEVNEYYWEYLERTKKELERLLACPDFENLTFAYRAY
jgi:hypothetical protein